LLPSVTVVLLNWNEWQDTSSCLYSLRDLDYSNYRVVVVDNASVNDSVVQIRERHPKIHVIENPKNVGFAGGCNTGIRYAQSQESDFIWLLNTDTRVDSGALRALVEKAQTDSRLGGVGSVIHFMDEPDRVQCWGGGYVNFILGKPRHFLKEVRDDRVEFITGCSLLLRRLAIDEIGLLDEGFFMYWEDGDICFRLRRAGWRLAVAGQSKIWHKGYTSIGKGRLSSYKNFNASAARFFRKHAPMPGFSIWLGFGMRLVKRLAVGDWQKLRATWDGIKQGRTAAN
jgi:GT2 family glycosyltransferase